MVWVGAELRVTLEGVFSTPGGKQSFPSWRPCSLEARLPPGMNSFVEAGSHCCPDSPGSGAGQFSLGGKLFFCEAVLAPGEDVRGPSDVYKME